MRELFGVELVDGVVDGVSVGEVDASLGEGGGDLFGGAPGGSSSKASWKMGR